MAISRKKIGILTYHAAHNYGAFLQSYALCMRIKDDMPDANVEIINFDMKRSRNYYLLHVLQKTPTRTFYNLKKYICFEQAKKSLPLSNNSLISNDMEDFQSFVRGKYDLIIAGSDEIWRIGEKRGFPSPYWLPGSLDAIKVSYAASSRTDMASISANQREQIQYLLKDFSYIGVRDSLTQQEISSLVPEKGKVHLNCDPSFIYDFSYDRKSGKKILSEKFKIKGNKKIVAMMLVDDKLVSHIKRNLGDQYAYISLNRGSSSVKSAILNPYDWINVISASDILITSFFHGVCFALNTDTQFLAIEEKKYDQTIQQSKIYDLLEQTSLTERYRQKQSNGLPEWINDNTIAMLNNNSVDFLSRKMHLRSKYESFKKTIAELLK